MSERVTLEASGKSYSSLTEFLRDAEKWITATTYPHYFVKAEDRDTMRVYTLARLAGIVASSHDVETMLAVTPALHEAILRSYKALVGSRRVLWWQAVEESTNASWPGYVRGALLQIAETARVPVAQLADMLDRAPMPKTRTRVIEIAREKMRASFR